MAENAVFRRFCFPRMWRTKAESLLMWLRNQNGFKKKAAFKYSLVSQWPSVLTLACLVINLTFKFTSNPLEQTCLQSLSACFAPSISPLFYLLCSPAELCSSAVYSRCVSRRGQIAGGGRTIR